MSKLLKNTETSFTASSSPKIPYSQIETAKSYKFFLQTYLNIDNKDTILKKLPYFLNINL